MERICYSGILAEMEEGPDRLSLVMVPRDTPKEQWGDPMKQYVFHVGEETRFSFPGFPPFFKKNFWAHPQKKNKKTSAPKKNFSKKKFRFFLLIFFFL